MLVSDEQALCASKDPEFYNEKKVESSHLGPVICMQWERGASGAYLFSPYHECIRDIKNIQKCTLDAETATCLGLYTMAKLICKCDRPFLCSQRRGHCPALYRILKIYVYWSYGVYEIDHHVLSLL